jgi:hypothetical protein
VYDAKDEYKRELERKINALTKLHERYSAEGNTSEARRISAKKEGVQMALDDARIYL